MLKRILIVVLLFMALPLLALANYEVEGLNTKEECEEAGYHWHDSTCYDVSVGLVPCGPEDHLPDCQLCHLFVIFGNVVDFFMTRMIPAAAIILIIFGGITLYTNSANPEGYKKGRTVILVAIAGVLIAYTAWVTVGLILEGMGMTEEDSWGFEDWWDEGIYKIDCTIEED